MRIFLSIIFLSWIGYHVYDQYLYPYYINKFVWPKWETSKRAEIAARHLKIDNEFNSAKLFISSNELSLIKSECGRYLNLGNLYFDECTAEKKERLYSQKINRSNWEEQARKNTLIIEKQKEEEMRYRMLEAYNAKKNQEPSFWEVIIGYKTLNNLLGNTANNASSCFLKSEAKSGMNKICYYNCTGSIKAKNVALADICPLTY